MNNRHLLSFTFCTEYNLFKKIAEISKSLSSGTLIILWYCSNNRLRYLFNIIPLACSFLPKTKQKTIKIVKSYSANWNQFYWKITNRRKKKSAAVFNRNINYIILLLIPIIKFKVRQELQQRTPDLTWPDQNKPLNKEPHVH